MLNDHRVRRQGRPDKISKMVEAHFVFARRRVDGFPGAFHGTLESFVFWFTVERIKAHSVLDSVRCLCVVSLTSELKLILCLTA